MHEDLRAKAEAARAFVDGGGFATLPAYQEFQRSAGPDVIIRLLDECDRLRAALGWFLADSRFVVSVGGNPLVVDKMLGDAVALYHGAALAEVDRS